MKFSKTVKHATSPHFRDPTDSQHAMMASFSPGPHDAFFEIELGMTHTIQGFFLAVVKKHAARHVWWGNVSCFSKSDSTLSRDAKLQQQNSNQTSQLVAQNPKFSAMLCFSSLCHGKPFKGMIFENQSFICDSLAIAANKTNSNKSSFPPATASDKTKFN